MISIAQCAVLCEASCGWRKITLQTPPGMAAGALVLGMPLMSLVMDFG